MIAGCINSVLAQQGKYSVEILVHDDASTDGSAEIVARDYPGVRLIRSESNVGFCVSNNRMVSEARGEYVLLLNNDAELLPNALQELLNEANVLSQPAILSLPQYDYFNGELIDRGCLLDPFFNPVPNLDSTRQDVAMVIGACLWIPTMLWVELGGFPEWFGSIGEDLYLCSRVRLAGYRVRILALSGYRHRVGQSFGGGKIADGRLVSTIRRRVLSECNKTFVMTVCTPALFLIPMLPLHLLMLLMEGVILSILKVNFRYFGQIYLPVFRELILKRSEWRSARVEVQNNKRISNLEFFSVFYWWPQKIKMLFRHGVPCVR